jgi:ADP-heptose:LPS heptosyltransferase
MKSIGFLQFGAMADSLYATPILRYIRDKHPKAHITWCIRDKFADIIATNPHLDAIKTYTLPTGYPTRQDAEHVMWRQMKLEAAKDFDLVIKPQQWPDHNFWRSNKDLISLMAENAGLDPTLITDRRIVLQISAEDERKAIGFWLDHTLGPLNSDGVCPYFITVNHISYAASPVWPFDNYQRLVELLHQKSIQSVFTGAPDEPIPDGAIDARGMPYMQWAAVIDLSNLYLGLDSGAIALACASDVPIIKLHSPDFPLHKTGCKAMGIRTNDIWEFCPAPTPETLAQLIVRNIR